MARAFDDGSTEYLVTASAVVMAMPLTIAAWVFIDDDSADKAFTFVSISDDAGGSHYYAIQSNTYGGNVVQAIVNDGGGAAVASTSTGFTINTWHHVCGTFTNATSRACYIDSGSKGTNATDRTPAGLDETLIGVRHTFAEAFPHSGHIAGAVIWKCALNDAEVVAHFRGKPPWEIQPWAYIGSWPLRFNRTWDRDIAGRGGHHMTPVNGPTWADDPPAVRKMWHDWEMRLRRKRWWGIEKPIYTAEIAWGHDTGVLEMTVRDLQHNWDGTGEVVNPGVADTEAMELASGEYMIGEITYTGAVDITITYNVYAVGDNINLDYRHGATPAACEAAGWNDYAAAFTSLGYVQVKVTSTL